MRKVVSVNTADEGSGAERVAWTMFKGFERRGLESWLVVGDKKSADPRVLPFFASPHIRYRSYYTPALLSERQAAKQQDVDEGKDDFHFPYAKYLPSITGSSPDVVLLHNLHGGYFDLRVLSRLSHRVPVFLYLHDCWTTTGHCAYPINCTRWQTGCGQCPDLTLPPAIHKDASNFNWNRKRDIFRESRLHVAAPTHWLMNIARQSILAPAITDSQVIPCPIDLRLFRPDVRTLVRRELGLPTDVHLLVSGAFQARRNPYKDHATVETAIHRLAQLMPNDKILLIALGDQAADQQVGNTRLQFLPFQPPHLVAKYLQAADVFVHAARAENFGLVTGEAQACGTPVVASDVGGLSEVIREGESGLLTPPGDAEQMAHAIRRLLIDSELRHRLGTQAAAYARKTWADERIVSLFLSWFRDTLQTHQPQRLGRTC